MCTGVPKNEMVTMLVPQTNPAGVELFFHVNTVFFLRVFLATGSSSENALFQIRLRNDKRTN